MNYLPAVSQNACFVDSKPSVRSQSIGMPITTRYVGLDIPGLKYDEKQGGQHEVCPAQLFG